jgi:hypothetical protein
MAVDTSGVDRTGASLWSMQPSAIYRTTRGEQQAQGWKHFSVAGLPRAIGKPTVDDSTLTYILGMDCKPGGLRLAWPTRPVKRFIAAASPIHAVTTAPLRSVATIQHCVAAGDP